MPKVKNKRLFIVIILTIIATIILLSFTSNRRRKYAAQNIPEITFDGDTGYLPEQSDNDVVVHATTGFIFAADSLDQKVNIENPAQNTYDFVVSIYLGDGTMLYQSNYINPGDCIAGVQLVQALKPGVYKNSVIAYQFCSTDDSHTVVSQCEFPIEIKCIN